MVCDWPPAPIVAVRASVVPLACAVSTTSPGPVPDAVPTAIHGALFDVVQTQPLCVTTRKRASPPAAPIFCEPGSTAYVHTGAAAACVTVWDWPPAVTVAVRA